MIVNLLLPFSNSLTCFVLLSCFFSIDVALSLFLFRDVAQVARFFHYLAHFFVRSFNEEGEEEESCE